MRYKDVFKIWLFANILLVVGTIVVAIFLLKTPDDGGLLLMAIGLGLGISLPALIGLIVFHWLVTKYSKGEIAITKMYPLAIIGINILYLLNSYLFFDLRGEFNWFYVATTAVGLISFYVVYKGIQRKIKKH